MDGLALLAQAHAAGLRILIDGDVLAITGAPDAAPLANQLLEHQADIIPLLQAEGTGGLPDEEPIDTQPSTALDAASAYLRTALAGNARSERELRRESQAHGISEKTLRRAKRHLNVKSKRQGKVWFWLPLRQDGQGQDGQHGQPQDGQGIQDGQDAQPVASRTFVGATGKLYTTVIAKCRQCQGVNWGFSGRHAPDGAEVWWCIDCARTPPKTPAPCASDRDAYTCPGCHDLYSLVKDAKGMVCYRCRRRF
jgi:hypothetical protein